MSLHYILSNNSKKKKKKNTNHRLVSLTGTNHDNSKLSRNIQFGKDLKVLEDLHVSFKSLQMTILELLSFKIIKYNIVPHFYGHLLFT